MNASGNETTRSNVAGVNTSFLANVSSKNLIAGVCGGVVPTALFHPLELIKIRWQVYEEASLKLKLINTSASTSHTIKQSQSYRPKYKSLIDTVGKVYQSENGIRGLYRGLAINSLASGSAWGIYFLIYNGLKTRHQSLINESNNTGQQLTVANYTMDATIAGVTTICITNPLFLIKTRMCLQYSNNSVNSSNSAVKVVKYKSALHAFRVLLKTEGVFGLYKGIVPGLFGTLNGTIQMVTYDLMKSFWLRHLERKHAKHAPNEPKPQLDTFHYSAFSSLSKILAVLSTYPFQLTRARLQDQHQNYRNFLDVIQRTYRNEKLYGFYKGLIPCLLRVTPAASVTFIVYENLLKFLDKIY